MLVGKLSALSYYTRAFVQYLSLKELFGDDMQITDGENVIGTKGIDEFDQDMTDEQLAAMEDLDLSTGEYYQKSNKYPIDKNWKRLNVMYSSTVHFMC